MKINKQDAAKSQLVTAIRLFSNASDMLSIHALTASAFQVTSDVEKSKKILEKIKNIVEILSITWSFLDGNKKEQLASLIIATIKNRKNNTLNKVVESLKPQIENRFSDVKPDLLKRFICGIKIKLPGLVDLKNKATDPIECAVDDLVNQKIISENKKGDVFKLLRNAQNFLKHAESDAEDTLDFESSWSEALLFISCEFYFEVFGKCPLLFSRYTCWYKLNNKALFTSEENKILFERAKKENLSIDNKLGFFEID